MNKLALAMGAKRAVRQGGALITSGAPYSSTNTLFQMLLWRSKLGPALAMTDNVVWIMTPCCRCAAVTLPHSPALRCSLCSMSILLQDGDDYFTRYHMLSPKEEVRAMVKKKLKQWIVLDNPAIEPLELVLAASEFEEEIETAFMSMNKLP